MEGQERRVFLEAVGAGIYGTLGVAVGVPALRFLLAPLRRAGGDAAFLRAAPLESIPAGKPTRLTIQAAHRDAYMQHAVGPVGSVWLSRDGDQVRCLQVICPHLGCGIDLSAEGSAFACPCHASAFDLSGRRRFGPSPRDMDELPCRVSDPDEQGVRWIEVQYAEFQTGVPDKRSLG